MAKTSTKSPKLTLDNASLEEEFFEDVVLLGMVSALTPESLAWRINQLLGMGFARNAEADILVDKRFHIVYEYIEQDKLVEHFLLANRHKMHFLLPEIKPIDYLWMIKGSHVIHQYTQVLPGAVSKIQQVGYCTVLDCSKLPHREYLIL